MNPDMRKVEAFAGPVVSDIAATSSGVMTNIVHKLAPYKAMAGAGPLGSARALPWMGTEQKYRIERKCLNRYLLFIPEEINSPQSRKAI